MASASPGSDESEDISEAGARTLRASSTIKKWERKENVHVNLITWRDTFYSIFRYDRFF
jgi:hypothetical protein